MSDHSSQQAAPTEGAASPRVHETEAKLRKELADYETRDDARIQGEEPPDAGWVIEAAQDLLAALDGTREARAIRTPDQLNALPEGAVVKSGHDVLERHHRDSDNGESRWLSTGYDLGVDGSDVVLPALLLWHPDWEAS